MKGKGAPRWWRAFAVLTAVAAVVVLVRRRFTRFEVAGESMSPAIEAGEYVLVDMRAYDRRGPIAGHVVLAADPREPGRTLVKRIADTDAAGRSWLLGDNGDASTDSRTFGWVAGEALVGRVRWRYWPLDRAGRVR